MQHFIRLNYKAKNKKKKKKKRSQTITFGGLGPKD